MFTGLVEGTGRLAGREGERLLVTPDFPFDPGERGASIAVNGCCLTLERRGGDGALVFFTLGETLSRTNLGELPVGAHVNLERALRAGAPLDGHLVQGHVDAACRVLEQGRAGTGDMTLKVAIPAEYAPLVVEKGSVAVDGVSLTVAALGDDWFSVCLIPETWQRTALPERTAGSTVNIEFDILGKYVQRQLACRTSAGTGASSGLTWEKLSEAGFL